jgi:DNA-binding transcriptional LysR family regulator
MFEGMNYIYEVYKEKSFSKAAKKLYISQPSLSAMVHKTESRIGAQIFDRSTNPIRLTECGEEYIKCIEKIIDIQNDFSNYLEDMHELKNGQFSVGASNMFASYILPPLIRTFTQKYPQVKVNLYEANTPLLTEKLSGGAIDLIMDNQSMDKSVFTAHPFCTEHLLLSVPKKYIPAGGCGIPYLTTKDILLNRHLNGGCGTVSLSAFGDSPFIYLRIGNDTRKRAEKICEKQHFSPNVILKLDQQATALHFSSYGMGISFVSDLLVRHARPAGNIVFYPINDEDAVRTVNFYHKNGKYLTRAIQEFLKISK